MKIWPGDLDTYDWWRSQDFTIPDNLPDLLATNSSLDFGIPLRAALARHRRHPTPQPVEQIETEWKGYPYRFFFEVPVTLWQMTINHLPYAFNTPQGHIVEGAVNGVLDNGELVVVTITGDQIEPQEFMHSWLWRIPLLGFLPKPRMVHLEVFWIEWRRWSDGAVDQGREVQQWARDNPDANVLLVRGFRRLTFYPYPALKDEVRAHTDEFAVMAAATGWRGR